MKKSIILCVAIFAAFTAFAQNTMATLNHNDTVTVYYGLGALRRAYTAAVDGDVISLSSGTFYKPTNISKAITIRGAGMCYDSLTNTHPTILTDSASSSAGNNMIINGVWNNNQMFVLEGVWCLGNINYQILEYARFSKVRLEGSFTNYNSSGSQNYYYAYCQFVQCIIEYHVYTAGHNNTFINCALMKITDGNYTLYNCVAQVSGSRFTAYNSILFTYGNITGYGICSASAYNCIGFVDRNANDEYFDDAHRSNNHTIYGNNKFGQVFRTPITRLGTNDDSYNFNYDTQKFFVTDNIIALYSGSDGTQVGIYGGPAPFTPRPDYIRIQQCTVAPRTTLDGKLNVDIEVINEH